LSESDIYHLRRCTLCPRRCGADRLTSIGLCGAGERIRIARASPHFWEEPCISGSRGSGTIFFSGCSLGCVFCQNRSISSRPAGGQCCGEEITLARFAEICFELKFAGVHNISLVTADHYVPLIAPVLRDVKSDLALPIVFNCSGYETPEMLDLLSGIVDAYLVDLKFRSPDISRRFARAPDYFDVASSALDLMLSQVGRPVLERGIMQRGVIVRHLVIPGCRKDSISIIDYLNEHYSPSDFLFSLMAQYTPNGAPGAPARFLTTFEYQSVLDALASSDFDGYVQQLNSADPSFTPPFDLTGVRKN